MEASVREGLRPLVFVCLPASAGGLERKKKLLLCWSELYSRISD